MNRLEQIQARLNAIAQELDAATGEALEALENEVAELTAERATIEAENARRQQLRSQVAAGAIGTPSPVAPAAATTPAETQEAQELRSFADFVRGAVTQMRTNEQNFTTANNGALIPTTIARRIIEKVREICPILAGAEVYYAKGKLVIPVYGAKTVSDTDHNVTAAYSSDFNELTADAGAFTSVELTGYLAGALALVGLSLLNNTDIDLVDFVVLKVAEALAIFAEGELLGGTGATYNHCTGALSTTNTMNAGSTSAVSADNLIDLQSKIPTQYQANACWTMHPATFTAIKKLKDGNGQYLLQSGGIVGAFPYTILGKPVYLSDQMPTIASGAKAILYGDYKGLGVKISENVSVQVLREKYATQHALGVIAWMELDSNVIDNQKLATLVMSA